MNSIGRLSYRPSGIGGSLYLSYTIDFTLTMAIPNRQLSTGADILLVMGATTEGPGDLRFNRTVRLG